jgi:hypothetical protein
MGKSTLIDSIVAYHESIGIIDTLRICATSNSSAANIDGITIHSLLNLHLQKPKEERLDGVETIVLDEFFFFRTPDFWKNRRISPEREKKW